MAYGVEIERTAAAAIKKLMKSEQRRVLAAIAALADNPRPAGAVKLAGAEAWRIRVGDVRIVYVIEDSILLVAVTRVGHRRDVYRSI